MALSGGRGRRRRVLLALTAGLLAGLFPGAGAVTADTTVLIDFEDQGGETQLGTQYKDKGVVFEGERPYVAKPGVALPSGTKAIVPGPAACDLDFGDPLCGPITMRFTPSPSRVRAQVGYNECLDDPATLWMRSYNDQDQLTDSDSVPLAGKQAVSLPLEVTGGVIAKVVVEVTPAGSSVDCQPSNRPLVLDNLEITTPAPLAVLVISPEPAATITPDPVEFGTAKVGGPVEERSVKVASTGTLPLDISAVNVEGPHQAEFTKVNDTCSGQIGLKPGNECRVDLRFQPTQPGARAATLSVATNEEDSPRTVELRGTGAADDLAALARSEITKGPLEFGESRQGTSGQRRAIVVTSVGAGPLNVDEVVLQPRDGDFVRTADSCATSLAPGRSCTIELQFRPKQLGPRRATVTVVTGAAREEHQIVLQGTGVRTDVPSATVSPAIVFFGRPGAGATSTLGSVRVISSGTAPLAVTGEPALGGDHAGDFEVLKGCGAAPLPVEAYCTIQLRFTPRGGGQRKAVLQVGSSAADSPHQVELRSLDSVAPAGLPTLSVSPGAARAAAEVVARGAGYQLSADLYWDSRDGPLLASVNPDGEGGIAVTVRVPDGATPGHHQVVGCDARQECATAALVTLPERDGGGPSWWFGLLAAGLLAGTLVPLRRVVRRRRPPAVPFPPGRAGPPPPPARGGPPLPPPPPRQRGVRTGFAPSGDYAAPLDPTVPLEPDQDYHFWLELDEAVSTGSGRAAVLTVAVFTYAGELVTGAGGTDLGEVELRPDGTTAVVTQGGLHVPARSGDGLLARRIFFPIRTPATEGRHRLRCSLYARQVLVQSWVVAADVRAPGRRSGPRRPAVADPSRAERDFVLSRSLDPGRLSRMQPHRLSLMLNQSDEGTHSLRVLGEGGYKDSADIGEAALQSFGTELRGALRAAASGREDEGQLPGPYRYAGPLDVDRLTADLITMARRGRRVYVAIAHELGRSAPAEGRTGEDRLRHLLRHPSRIQLANKHSPRHSLAAALLYDYKLDSTLTTLSLCPAFLDALEQRLALEDTPCFRGDCPSWEPKGRDLVCPSGFWGFRHSIGVMQSPDEEEMAALDVPETAGGAELLAAAAVSADPAFEGRDGHLRRLQDLTRQLSWRTADTRAETLELLAESQPQLVYFYCHGGVGRGMSYLQVGALDEDVLSGDALATWDVLWDRSHPLVIINGCHTTALGPSTPLDLVSAFLSREASGVIGTEVTVYEALAGRFAEELVPRLVAGTAVGDAVRGARLALLREGNPLGLVYVPFAANDLVLSMGRSVPVAAPTA